MGSRGLVEKHHVHLGDQVRDHERRFWHVQFYYVCDHTFFVELAHCA